MVPKHLLRPTRQPPEAASGRDGFFSAARGANSAVDRFIIISAADCMIGSTPENINGHAIPVSMLIPRAYMFTSVETLTVLYWSSMVNSGNPFQLTDSKSSINFLTDHLFLNGSMGSQAI